MAYDVFSQLQGPQIDVNLFPNSASAGIRAGNALPSPLSAGIQGAIEGVQTGQKIYDQYQNSQIKQNQIEQQPVANARAQADLENEQAIATINKNKAEIAELTQATQLKIAQQQSDNELAATKKKADDTTNDDTIFKALSSNDPNEQAAVVNDQKLFSHLLQNPKLLDQAAGILQNSDVVSQDQKDALVKAQGYYKDQELQFKREAAEAKTQSTVLKNFDKIAENYKADGQLLHAQAESGLGDVQFAGSVETRAQGLSSSGKQMYDVYVGDVKQSRPIDETSNQALLRYQSALVAQGSITRKQLKAPNAPTSTPTPSPSWWERNITGTAPVAADKTVSNNLLGNSPAPTATSTPSNTPAPADVPAPTANNQIKVNSDNPIVQQRKAQLESRLNDPDIRNRLIVKGMLADTAASVTPTLAPTAIPPISPEPTPSPSISPTQTSVNAAIEPEVIVPPRPEPKSLKQNISYVTKATPGLPEDSNEVMHRVLTEPLLSNLSPLKQAVAAVESSGQRKTKPTRTSTATGLFALTAPTARSLKVNPNVPEQNVIGGTKLLDSLLTRYNDAEVPALMAYNLGEPVINAAADIAGSYEYEDLVSGIDYLKSHGYFSKILTPGNVKAGKAYPIKVLAYKKAFESISNA